MTALIAALLPATGGTPAAAGTSLPSPGADVMIVNRHSGKCLDVAWQYTADGTAVVQASCWNGPNQRWRLEPVGSESLYRIRVRHTGKCLTVRGVALQQMAFMIQQTCGSAPSQQWMPIRSGGDSPWSFVTRQSLDVHLMDCLDILYGSTAEMVNAVQMACSSGNNRQLWDLVPAGQP